MNSLRGHKLETEYAEIVSKLDGDLEGREQGQAYLASTHVKAGVGPQAWALTPKIYTSDELQTFTDAAETMGRILEKLIDRFAKDEDFRALFGFDHELEQLSLVPTGYGRPMAFARLDALFNEETGDLRFCGVATDSPAGMTAAVDVARAVQLSESYRRFADRHRQIESFDLVEEAVGAIRETYRSWANAGAGVNHPDHPAVGIVDYPEDATPDEFADAIERMADDGVYARFVDIRDLRIERGADGIRRLVDSEGPIACVWRRALATEMALKPCEGASALVDAARFGIACVINGFGAWPVSTNRLFAIIHSPAVESILEPQEVAFARAHTPESHVLKRGDDLSRYIADRDSWAVRPAGTYSVREIVAGRDCSDPDDWWRVLLACSEEGGVIQAFDPAYSSDVVLGGGPDGASQEVAPVNAAQLCGLYLFRGKFGGVWARCGYQGAAGNWSNRVNLGALIVRE